LKKLSEIDLRYTRTSRGGIDALGAALPRARVIYLDQAPRPVLARASKMEGKGDAAVGAWVRSMGGEARMEGGTVRWVSLASSPVNDAQLERLTGLRGLRGLNLEATEVGDLGLRHVARLGSLEELNLSGSSVSDSGLQHLAPLKSLVSLRLENTYV